MNAFLLSTVFFGLLAVHSFVTYPLSLLILRRLRPAPEIRPRGDNQNQTISLICCVCNEDRVIERKIEDMLALSQKTSGVDILVYNDASSDRTGAIIDRFGDRIAAIHGKTRLGKTIGVQEMIEASEAELIILTDTTANLDEEMIRRVREDFSDQTVGCVSGDVVFTNVDEGTSAEVSGIYGRLQNWTKKLETETGSVVGVGGAFFVIRRNLYVKTPPYIMDDLHSSLSVLCQGYRAVFEPAIKVKKRVPTEGREEFNRKVRIACRQVNVLRHIWPRFSKAGMLNLYKFFSRYVLRWITGFTLLLAALSGVLWLGSLGALHIGLGLLFLFAIMCFVGRVWEWPVFGALGEIMWMFIAVAIGVIKALRGEKFQTWESAQSIRATN
jgi:cellulose synthase/poly-beta-1,6-N-acetylglucosamine synthase-like glycosyltransferase